MRLDPSANPYQPAFRDQWLAWQVSCEVSLSIDTSLQDPGQLGAGEVLKEWLRHDRRKLVSHCMGAVNVYARDAGIQRFTREEVQRVVDLMAYYWKVS